MKRIVFLCVIYLLFSEVIYSQQTGTLIDERDGQVYGTVKIGNQWWMSENLNYEIENSSWCYDYSSEYCDTCGKLYSWEEAQTACPEGWHVPTDFEWLEFDAFVGVPEDELYLIGPQGNDTIADFLSTGGSSGFNARNCGYRVNGNTFGWAGIGSVFQSSTEIDSITVYDRDVYPGDWVRFEYRRYMWDINVRCISNENSIFTYKPQNDTFAFVGAYFEFEVPDSMFYMHSNDSLNLSVVQVTTDWMLNGPANTIINEYPLPEWLVFDSITNRLKGTPLEEGAVTIKIIAENKNEKMSTDVFNLNIVKPYQPVVNEYLPDTVANIGQTFTYKIPDNFIVNNPDDVLSYSVTLNTGEDLPDWLKFDPFTNTLSGTPGETGKLYVKVVATNTENKDAMDIFKLNIKENTSGIMHTYSESVIVYPNPVENYIYIRNTSGRNIIKNYNLLDISGRLIQQGTYNNQKIDVSNIGSGVYFLQLFSTQEISSTRILIE